jgi:ketosteroid isomerase-like protein
MPNSFEMIRVKEKVAKLYAADTATVVFKIKDRICVEMEIYDSIAYTVNSSYYTWHNKGDDPNWRKTKNIHLWKKDEQGNWKLHLDI